MFQIIVSILLISIIPVFVGVLTLFLPSFNKSMVRFMVSFAGGVMLGNAFFDLLPESITESGSTFVLNIALFGIVIFFLLEKYFLWHCHNFGLHSHKSTTFLVMTGDTIHNFLDGVVVAGAYLASPFLGLTTSIAIALHEIPQELADFSVLVSDGVKPRKAVLLNFLSGLVAVIGGVAGYVFLSSVQATIPYFTAFAAGMFIYIACSDLIPKTHDSDKKSFDLIPTFFFLLGIVSIKAVTQLVS